MPDVLTIKTELHNGIENGDERLLQMLCHVLEEYNQPADPEQMADSKRRALIRDERERCLKGEGRSFSWEEVKDMALNPEKRYGL